MQLLTQKGSIFSCHRRGDSGAMELPQLEIAEFIPSELSTLKAKEVKAEIPSLATCQRVFSYYKLKKPSIKEMS